jgi:putative tryptophan/tyrosine transport system substrate-binding protein
MKAKILVYALPALILTTIHLAEAQQLRKTSRIGLLSGSGPATNPANLEAFRQGLRELGYVEGGNIYLSTDGGRVVRPPARSRRRTGRP